MGYDEYIYKGRLDDHDNRCIIPHDLYQLHQGNHYFYKTWVDITGASTVSYFMFQTPDTTTAIHAKAKFHSEGEFTISINEGGTVPSLGTTITTFNNYRDSSNTPLLKAYSINTITSLGTSIWAAKIGSGKSDTGVAPELGYEIIAKRAETYIFKIVHEVAGTSWLDVDFYWLEHNGT